MLEKEKTDSCEQDKRIYQEELMYARSTQSALKASNIVKPDKTSSCISSKSKHSK